ncbi:hypothetical protein RJ639_000448 [Escallonia herrerae]|uniref:Cation efflux protein cytoplasmic domain-containing protein n=1 Tax=Escallonia herrerae TaxID=1293975 RepID=A0AA88X8E4_9ASTE|nr:hypothetical protein RJ639_000448 [Escallonia herrerae]
MEYIISNMLSSEFPGNLVVERITSHSLQGKILLQVEVSMPPDILIRDAMKIAEEAEKHILEAFSNVIQVCIQLRLGHAISQVNH